MPLVLQDDKATTAPVLSKPALLIQNSSVYWELLTMFSPAALIQLSANLQHSLWKKLTPPTPCSNHIGQCFPKVLPFSCPRHLLHD